MPLPPKIQIFMWLTFRNRILTKVNLSKRGWTGITTCMFCDHPETTTHMFLHCQLTKQVIYWLGSTQIHYQQWKSLKDVFRFANSLSKVERTAFLLVFSATCWTLWKHRNEVCFQGIQPKSARTLICLIMSLVLY